MIGARSKKNVSAPYAFLKNKRKKKKYILPVTQKKTKRTDLRILKILMLIIPKLLKIKKLKKIQTMYRIMSLP